MGTQSSKAIPPPPPARCCLSDLFSSSRSIFGSVLPAPVSAPAPDPNSPPAQVEGTGVRGPKARLMNNHTVVSNTLGLARPSAEHTLNATRSYSSPPREHAEVSKRWGTVSKHVLLLRLHRPLCGVLCSDQFIED